MAKQKSQKKIKIFPTIEEISKFAANEFVKLSKKAIKKTGRFSVALAGGSTPKSLYQLLATEKYRDKIDWNNVYFFIGDERDVSPMSEMSNFRMINEILFKNIRIHNTNIFRWHTEIINAPEVSASYNRALINFFKVVDDEVPKFDLILLGMGDDGHTASLFPFTKALNETDKFAVENYVEKINSTRLTLTFPIINNASNILFLVSGENKCEVLSEVLEDEINVEKYPSQGVFVKKGNLTWLLDEAASNCLSS